MSIYLMVLLLLVFGTLTVVEIAAGRHTFAGGSLLIAVVLASILTQRRRAEQESKDFLLWLLQAKEQVKQGSASFNGVRVTPDTQLVQYGVCVSILFATVTQTSSTILPGTGLARRTAVFFTLGTLTLGWWGLPWGPVRTLQMLVQNLTGGAKKRVATVIEDLEANLARTEMARTNNQP